MTEFLAVHNFQLGQELRIADRNFQKTKDYRKACDCLQGQGRVTLTGTARAGKTATARRLLKLYQGARKLQVRDPEAMMQLLEHDVRRPGVSVVVVEDMFGRLEPSQNEVSRWREVLFLVELYIRAQRAGDFRHQFRFIFISRHIQSQTLWPYLGPLRKWLFHPSSIVTVNSFEELSIPSAMLNNYQTFLTDIIANKPAQAMLLAALVLLDGKLMLDTLKQGSELVGHKDLSAHREQEDTGPEAENGQERAPKRMRITEEQIARYNAVLWEISRALVPCRNKARDVTVTSLAASVDSLKRYVRQEQGYLFFQDPTHLDVTCRLLGNQSTELLLQSCSSDFLYDRVRLGQSDDPGALTILVQSNLYPTLVNRFVEELQEGNVLTVCLHPATSNPQLAADLVQALDSQQELLTRRDRKGSGTLLSCAALVPDGVLFGHLFRWVNRSGQANSFLSKECLTEIVTNCCLSDNVKVLNELRQHKAFLQVLTEPLHLNSSHVLVYQTVKELLSTYSGMKDFALNSCLGRLTTLYQRETMITLALKHWSNKVVKELITLTARSLNSSQLEDVFVMAVLRDNAEAVRTCCDYHWIPANSESVLRILANSESVQGAREVLSIMTTHGIERQDLPSVVNALSPSGVTPLMLASLHGDADMVGFLLENEITVLLPGPTSVRLPLGVATDATERGLTALMMAAYKGHTDVVARLLPVSNASAVDSITGLDALMLAAAMGHSKTVEVLIPHSNVKAKNKFHCTAFTTALAMNQVRVCRILRRHSKLAKSDLVGFTTLCLVLDTGVPLFQSFLDLHVMPGVPKGDRFDCLIQQAKNRSIRQSGAACTPLMHAVRGRYHTEVVQLLLSVSDAKDHCPDGLTALMYAARNHYHEVLEPLIGNSDVKASDVHGRTALMHAVMQTHPDPESSTAKSHRDVVARLMLCSDVKAVDSEGLTALMHAVKRGNSDIVKLLLPQSKAKAAERNGKTALMLAVLEGNVPIVSLLIPHSNVKADEQNGKTALMLAVLEGNVPIVHLLIPHSDVKAAGQDGKTALMLAVLEGNVPIVSLLISHSNVKAADASRVTALMYSAEKGNSDIVQLLIPGSDVEARDDCGRSALMFAAKGGHFETAWRLLHHGSDALAADIHGYTALMYAASTHNAKLVNFLIPRSHVTAASKPDDVTALMLAAQTGNPDVTKLLLAVSDVTACDTRGRSALMYAAQGGNAKTVDLLIPFSDVDAADVDGCSALMHAALGGHLGAMQSLITESQASSRDSFDNTALVLASKAGHDRIVEELLQVCDVNAANKDGRTALMEAARGGHSATVEVLIAQSDIGARDCIGETARMKASKNGHHEIARRLAACEDGDALVIDETD